MRKPSTSTFCSFDLRTTDADAARSFYARLLGHDRAAIWPLHEQARARGAAPHWLGSLGVDDVARSAAAFVERGAVQLGPTQPTRDGGERAVLRDPGGAVMAVATPPREGAAHDVDVVWHVLHTSDAAGAATNYRELCGWELTERVDVAGHGAFQQFAWQPDGPNVGAIGDVAGRPGVHAHWLFFFEVDALEPAMELTRAAGGVVMDAVVLPLPGGARACVCDDPQGAAFALRERRG